MNHFKKSLLATLGVAAATLSMADVNVYSYRQEFLVKPIFEQFTKETGIKVNSVYLKKGLAERIKREGKESPADVVLTVDISRLQELVNMDLVQAIKSETVEKNIPANLRGDKWVALTMRARAVYSSKDRVGKLPEDFDYLDLAKPEWKGKISTRSGKHPYNLSLIASMIAHHGKEKTKAWLEGVKANLARKPQGNDRQQVKAIKEGIADLSLGNSYYFGKMITNEKHPEQKEWAASVYINFPNQKTTGTHMNVSGVALAKYSPNKEEAMKFIDFLTGDSAQATYAEMNFEYPVKPGVKASKLVSSWGDFKKDDISVLDIAKHYDEAAKLVDEVKFDL
ncbi:MAG: iron ABC transporter substrate-binding protein [Gammaproteobacteria bacterium]|nr:MAG: iron ABC transporter substrate-binding protein [Gammaproteobacteria bacterium]